MNCQLRRLWVAALLGLVLWLETRAEAQAVVDMPRIEVSTPPPESERPVKPPELPNEKSAVATIHSSYEELPTLSRVLTEHLHRRGIQIVSGSAEEAAAACTTPECLESLVRHENVGFLFTAQVDESSPESLAITVTLFDVVRRAALQESATCSQCNKTLLGHKLNDIADELISRCREARLGNPVPNQTLQTAIVLPPPPPAVAAAAAAAAAAPTPAAAQTPAAPPPIAMPATTPTVLRRPPQPRGLFARLPASRRVLAGVLGGLAGAALLTSIVLTATDGLDTPLGCDLRTDVLQDKCVLKNKPLYATGYALTGALAIGIGFTLFWPTKSAPASVPEKH